MGAYKDVRKKQSSQVTIPPLLIIKSIRQSVSAYTSSLPFTASTFASPALLDPPSSRFPHLACQTKSKKAFNHVHDISVESQ